MYPWAGMPTWDQLSESQKEESARDMEVYAAMIDYMDEQISRVFDWLDKNEQMDNTLIIFFSDNGANGAEPTAYPGQTQEFLNSFDNSFENRGLIGSFIEQGPGWATASMSPRRLFKAFTTEGGISSPCIIKLPGTMEQKGGMSHSFTHVSDIMPTLLDLADIDHPSSANTEVPGMMGKSLLPLLHGQAAEIYPNEGIGYELHGLCAYIKGDWKILRMPKPFGTGDWELFNLNHDPAEARDLSAEKPEKLSELVSAWEEYSENVGVVYDPIDMSIVREKQ
jgi:arylsulfatase